MAKINNKAPGISMTGDLDILKTNTSRAVKSLHDNILILEKQNEEMREMLDQIGKELGAGKDKAPNEEEENG